MNRKNARNFLSFAFLIVIIYSALLPVFSLQNNMSISSHGIVNYSEPSTTPPSPIPTPSPPVTEKYVGFRCNGEDTVDYWISVANTYASWVPNTKAGGIWVIPSSKVLTYDAQVDSMLSALDDAGIKVYLQPGEEVAGVWNQYPAPCDQLIQATLNNYGHHSCVIGVGIDVEERGSVWDDYEGCKVSDLEAQSWENQVKAYNPNFELFLKHWLTYVMPPSYRGDIVFVNMDGWVGAELLNEYQAWGNHFPGNKVSFQIGYGNTADRNWWSQMSNPPQEIANWIFQNILNSEGVYWVNVGGTVYEVFPDLTPTPIPYQGTNLAPLNEWHETPPQWAPSYWEENAFNGKPAWRNEYAGTTKTREMNSDWIAINPGDRIVFLAWMKMDPTSRAVDEVTPDMGCRIGLDWYTNSGPIKNPDTGNTEGVAWNPEGAVPTYPQPYGPLMDNYVPPGSDWTLRVIDLTVPSTVHGETPTGTILWWGLPHYVYGEQATAWLSETEFYINPT